jgi:hypothetical protein
VHITHATDVSLTGELLQNEQLLSA